MKLHIITIFLSLVFSSAYLQAGNVPDDASGVCPIKVGQTLPELTLKNIDGGAFDLNKAVSSKPTILIFYRGSWCPYCNVHLGEIKTVESDLKALGYQVIAVSPDLPKNLKKSMDKNGLDYQLVSDSNALAAKSLGLAFRVDADTYKKYLGYGINLENASGETHHLLPIPAAIILDKAGVVKFAFTSPDYKVRVDTSVLLAAAKAAVAK